MKLSRAGWLLAAVVLLSGFSCRQRRATPPDTERTRIARHVILVGLDGFRPDYLDRAEAPRLRALAERGVRAERMLPVFPSKTFPNHYSIVTGLWAEEHGIVANNMRDPQLGRFTQRDAVAQNEPRWWGGEPIWATAERQGVRAGIVSWPGSEAAIPNRPTWWQRYDHDETPDRKIAKVLRWLELPRDSAPGFIAIYFHDTDSDGHSYGPAAPETNRAIARVDQAFGTLEDAIARIGLRDSVVFVVVSDHGMTPSSVDRTILLDQLIDTTTIDVIDWTPVGMVAPRDGDAERVYRTLAGKHPHLQVYRREELPARWHFRNNDRIPPIVLVADEGWNITTTAAAARWRARGQLTGGQHGYDPELPSMGALFIAAGPGIAEGRRLAPFRNVHVYSLLAHLLGLEPARTSGTLDSLRAALR